MSTQTLIIQARRKYIQDNAACDGCGATLAACDAQRGTDPQAPQMGCCYQYCRHVQNERALSALLDEIEAGNVRTLEEAYPAREYGPRRASMAWLLHQDTWWCPKGRPPILIADMDREWRYNVAQFLVRRAASLAQAEAWSMLAMAAGPLGPSGDMACDAFEAEVDFVNENPVEWLRSTALYEALVKGLPTNPKKVAKLAARAVHWSDCPGRNGESPCTCATAAVAA